jgi:L-seryl-tRNA(Ser) seleniumtransferase
MVNLSGAWIVRIRFALGEARHSMQLEQQGEELKGRYRSLYGEREVRGQVRDGQVHLRVPIYYQGVGVTYGFSGRLNGDQLSGEVDLGEYWKATWEAERTG